MASPVEIAQRSAGGRPRRWIAIHSTPRRKRSRPCLRGRGFHVRRRHKTEGTVSNVRPAAAWLFQPRQRRSLSLRQRSGFLNGAQASSALDRLLQYGASLTYKASRLQLAVRRKLVSLNYFPAATGVEQQWKPRTGNFRTFVHR